MAIHCGQLAIVRDFHHTSFYLVKNNKRIGYLYTWSSERYAQIAYSCFEENKGYMTQALLLVTPFISPSFRQLFISINNIASIRVATKAGYKVYYTIHDGKTLIFRHPSYRRCN